MRVEEDKYVCQLDYEDDSGNRARSDNFDTPLQCYLLIIGWSLWTSVTAAVLRASHGF